MKTTLEFEHGEETQAKIAQGSYDAYCSLTLLWDSQKHMTDIELTQDVADAYNFMKDILDQWYTTEDLDG